MGFNMTIRAFINVVLILCSFVFLLFLGGCTTEREKTTQIRDFDEIANDGVLTVVTGYSPVSYFIYRGQPMGYEYELLKRLGESTGLEIELTVARDFDEMIRMLNNKEVDLIAYNLTITQQRRQMVAFTTPLNVTRQVLVQRKPESWRRMRIHETERLLIRNPIELAGRDVHVRRASSYLERMLNLQNEIGEDINIIEAESGVTTEQLIRMVAEREIDFTVSDENIARLNQSYFPILDINTPLSLPQQTAWAVRESSVALRDSINSWLEDFQTQTDYYVIYNKYFENRRAFTRRIDSDLLFSDGGKISLFDELIQTYSEQIGWDWLLLASLIFQESQFNPDARSWAGAQGLMQLMPRTANAHGATDPFDPEQSIRAGVSFIEWLNNYWSNHIEDENERIKFILGSYNVGHGHVQDARRLAREFGADPDVWDGNVARFLLKKSQQEYYTHEVVRFGYARGFEPVNYVNNILYIYNHYQSMAHFRDESRRDDPALAVD